MFSLVQPLHSCLSQLQMLSFVIIWSKKAYIVWELNILKTPSGESQFPTYHVTQHKKHELSLHKTSSCTVTLVRKRTPEEPGFRCCIKKNITEEIRVKLWCEWIKLAKDSSSFSDGIWCWWSCVTNKTTKHFLVFCIVVFQRTWQCRM
jgi:hypothetical protein